MEKAELGATVRRWLAMTNISSVATSRTRSGRFGIFHFRTVRLLAVTTAAVVFATSCSNSSDAGATSSTEAASPDEVTTTVAPSTSVDDATTDAPVEAPAVEPLSGLDGAIGQASDLALSWLNGAPVDETVYEASFDDAFRAAVPFSGLTPVLEQVALDAPYVVREVQEATDTEAQLIVVGSSGTPGLLAVSIVTPDDPTMNGLFIGPAEQPTFDAPASADDAIARLEAMGTLRLAVLDTDCAVAGPAVAADEQAPIGSIFKLWVLSAVVDAVDAGSITWDDDVEVDDELDSIPSGTTQNDEPGTLLTVRELAERMIEISDNTATDHLMELVGREAVEQAMIDSGHGDPSRNLPLMNTREFTIVKFDNDQLRARYLEADEAERRRMLDDEVASMDLPPVANIVTVTDPIEVEQLEWFASPTDLCRVLISLSDDEEASAILTRNPGMPDTTGQWAEVLYKGGSEPGVFAMAWLTVAEDGTRSVVAGTVSNEEEVIDEFEAANLLAFIRDAR